MAESSRRLRVLVVLFIGLPTLGLLGLTLNALVAPRSYLGAPFCDVRWTLGLCAVALALVALLARAPRWAAVALLLALFHCAPGLSLWLPSRSEAEPEPGTEIRVAAVNLWIGNTDPKATCAWLKREEADVVFLSELCLAIRPELLKRMMLQFRHYSLSPSDPTTWGSKTWGRALFSRYPIEEWEALDEHGKVMRAVLDVEGSAVQVIGAHANKPSPGYGAPLRDDELRRIAEASRSDPTTIVLGDLNATTTTPSFRSLLKGGELRDSRQGFGRQPSWSSMRPVRGINLGIDHVLVGSSWLVIDRRVGPPVGSDHRGVIATLAKKSAATAGK